MNCPKCGAKVLYLKSGLCERCSAIAEKKPKKRKVRPPEQREERLRKMKHANYLVHRQEYAARAKKFAEDNPEKRRKYNADYAKRNPGRNHKCIRTTDAQKELAEGSRV